MAATTVSAPRAGRTWRSRLHSFDIKASPYAYIAPFFLLFAAFGLYPLIYTAVVSLTNRRLIQTTPQKWVGFDNYVRLFHDPNFWNALWNTLSLLVLSTVPQLLLALWLAHLLNTRLRARTLFRMG